MNPFRCYFLRSSRPDLPIALQQPPAEEHAAGAAQDARYADAAKLPHALAQEQRRAEEQCAGHHAEHEPVNRGLQAAMIEMHVELAAFDLLQNIAEPPRQNLDELFDFGVNSPHLLYLPHRREPPSQHLLLIRLDQLHQAELRLEKPACAVEHDQHLDQHRKRRGQRDVVALHDLDHLGQSPGQVKGVGRLVGVVDDELGEIDRKRRFVETRRHRAEPHHERSELLSILRDDRHQHVFDVFAKRVVEPADHAEIEQADRTVRQHDQVARMRIGMIEAVMKDHLEVHVGAVACDLAEIDVGKAARSAGSENRSPSSHSIVSTRDVESSG